MGWRLGLRRGAAPSRGPPRGSTPTPRAALGSGLRFDVAIPRFTGRAPRYGCAGLTCGRRLAGSADQTLVVAPVVPRIFATSTTSAATAPAAGPPSSSLSGLIRIQPGGARAAVRLRARDLEQSELGQRLLVGFCEGVLAVSGQVVDRAQRVELLPTRLGLVRRSFHGAVAETTASAAPAAAAAKPTAAPTEAPSVAPGETRVEVLNGSSRPGIALQTADRLREKGFQVVAVGNADRADYADSRLLAQPGSEAAANAVATALGLPAAAVQDMPTAGGGPDVRVILGQSYQLPVR